MLPSLQRRRQPRGSGAPCSSVTVKNAQLQQARLVTLAAPRFPAHTRLCHCSLLINPLPSSWLELIFLSGLCAHSGSAVSPVLHLQSIFL